MAAPPLVAPSIPLALPTVPTERLVCSVLNGVVWGPKTLSLDDAVAVGPPSIASADGSSPPQQSQRLRRLRFEFALMEGHLRTIFDRSDLAIVVGAHRAAAGGPLQACHWPDEAYHVVVNGTALPLDRSVAPDPAMGGAQTPAHRVCCVKSLCRTGTNTLEIVLTGSGAADSTSPAAANDPNSLKVSFAVF